MRTIFINGRFYGQPISGVQRYSHEIVNAIDARLASAGSATEWVLLTPPGVELTPLKAIAQRTVPGPASHGWDQVSFYRQSASGVALSLGGTGPLLHRRQIVTIHDAAPYRHPEHFGRSYGMLHRTLGRVLAKTATLATVSAFSQLELGEILKVLPQDIILAPNGSDHITTEPASGIVSTLGLDDTPYFLVLGNLTRNKNLAQAVRALGLLPPGRAKLVAVGSLNSKLFGEAGLPTSDDLVLPGRLSDAEVVGLMQQARALVFPSIYEGFGIPPVEAMMNGCPVLASRIPAVEEVCGDAAAYFDLFDDVALAELMTRAIDDEGWRIEMVTKGRARARGFRWDAPAATLIDAATALAEA